MFLFPLFIFSISDSVTLQTCHNTNTALAQFQHNFDRAAASGLTFWMAYMPFQWGNVCWNMHTIKGECRSFKSTLTLHFKQCWIWMRFTGGNLVDDILISDAEIKTVCMYDVCIAFGGHFVDNWWKSSIFWGLCPLEITSWPPSSVFPPFPALL